MYPILAKIGAESLLSLYPVFVKKIGLPIPTQLWLRLLAYVTIALFFVSYAFLKKTLFLPSSIFLALINTAHLYFSYEGFKYLESGVSFSIFNTYPLMILLMAGEKWNPGYLFAIAGLLTFVYGNYQHQDKVVEKEDKPVEKEKEKPEYHQYFLYGVIMILLAAITEAMIYFLIKGVPTTNSWNHVFVSYFLGAIILTLFMFYQNPFDTNPSEKSENKSEKETFMVNLPSTFSTTHRMLLAFALNGLIGALGYFLRFYSAYRLDAKTFSLLSYFGIIMAYIYGILMNDEILTIYKVIGTLFIFLSKYMVIFHS